MMLLLSFRYYVSDCSIIRMKEIRPSKPQIKITRTCSLHSRKYFSNSRLLLMLCRTCNKLKMIYWAPNNRLNKIISICKQQIKIYNFKPSLLNKLKLHYNSCKVITLLCKTKCRWLHKCHSRSIPRPLPLLQILCLHLLLVVESPSLSRHYSKE